MIASCVRGAGYGHDRIRIDPSVVRGLEYYTGPVFEAELTFEVQGRRRPARALRLGRRRRALRRARRALPRRAGSGDRLFDRRLAAARGVARDQKPDRRSDRDARPRRRARARPRRGLDGELSAARRELAPGGDRGRALSGLGRHERAAQICGPAQEPRRRHPGLERAQRAPAARRSRSAISTSAPSLRNRPRTAPTIWNCASAPSFPRPRRSWSSGCARFWRGSRAGCFWLESRLGFPNQLRSDLTCWLGGGQQGCRSLIRKTCVIG